jgi:1,4-alpha-glucan branching enzyme
MNDTIRKTNGNGPAKRPVRSEFTRPGAITTFEFNHPTATTISVAGTFNDWRPGAAPMIPLGAGRWIKALTLPPGKYEYRLVVDGKWMCDPLAAETVPNSFGELNSVLRVPDRNGADET